MGENFPGKALNDNGGAGSTVPVDLGTVTVPTSGQPAVSVFAAWLIVGETITRWQLPGMALMITGMALVVWFSQRAPDTA